MNILNRIAATLVAMTTLITPLCAAEPMSESSKELLKGKKILFVERNQYKRDHHNTATLFMVGEWNESSYDPGGAIRLLDVDSGEVTTLLESEDGVMRDPEISFDGTKIIFSMRKSAQDSYHIYEIGIDGRDLKQLTWMDGVADIDPIYLPDGGIIFGSTRQPKYCMCNRHIMANLYRMNGDGSNITQIGVSTLFEGHPTLLPDGRVLYDRWEYVDRNFSNAQALWVVNPDGTKHSIYYGNNTSSPDGVIDARHIPGTDLVACIFGNCHDRPTGALAVIDRKLGVDGEGSVVNIFPKEARNLISESTTGTDLFRNISTIYEDPYPIDVENILVSRSTTDTLNMRVDFMAKNGVMRRNVLMMASDLHFKPQMALYLVNRMSGEEEMILKGERDLFDPMIIEPHPMPNALPEMRNYTDTVGRFYVQNVYEGTHMEGVEPGSIKYLRVIESMEKRTFTKEPWQGQGQLAPGVNWHNFDIKRIVSEVPVEEDGSANFIAPAGRFLYFQLLDKDKKMVQTMRSGVSLMPGETNGCIGCHEDRLQMPMPSAKPPTALKKPAHAITGWMGKDAEAISYLKTIQPILDKHCVSCHDFDPQNREKLVLAGDLTPYFNVSYTNLYVKDIVNLIGAGPATFQQPYAWGSSASRLTKIVDSGHKGVRLSQQELERLYAWMDLNGSYYPMYESAYDDTPAGRSPLSVEEIALICELTGLNMAELNHNRRDIVAQFAFDRPELSPCLDNLRDDTDKYNQVLALIEAGAERLKERPRGDTLESIVLCDRHKMQISRYIERMEGENQNSCNIDVTTKRFDPEP